MQLVPQILREAQQIRMARAMHRGRGLRRLPSPAEAIGLVVPLLAFAIRHAGHMAVAMEARGFGSARNRTIINVPGFGRADAVFASGGLASLAFAIIAV
jgi:energy-coupling factor transport system permease protein